MPLHLVAVVCPPEVEERVKEWKSFMFDSFGTRVALKSPAHITLIPPFHLPSNETSRLQESLQVCLKEISPFSIELKDFAAFQPRVIYVDVIPNPRLTLMKGLIEEALLLNGFPIKKENRPFHPHVTIANRDLQKQDFPLAWSHFSNKEYYAIFQLHGVQILRHDGSVWKIVSEATFPEL